MSAKQWWEIHDTQTDHRWVVDRDPRVRPASMPADAVSHIMAHPDRYTVTRLVPAP